MHPNLSKSHWNQSNHLIIKTLNNTLISCKAYANYVEDFLIVLIHDQQPIWVEEFWANFCSICSISDDAGTEWMLFLIQNSCITCCSGIVTMFTFNTHIHSNYSKVNCVNVIFILQFQLHCEHVESFCFWVY